MEQAHVVLGEGSQVVIGQVDMFGFLGRDHHPKPTDVGSVGYVVKSKIECWADPCPGVRDAYGGEPIGEDEVAIYLVATRDGRLLEILDYEMAD